MNNSILQKELDMVIEKSTDNIVIADAAGTVLQTSPNIHSIYGVTTEAFIGKTVYELERDEVLKPSITRQVFEQNSEVQNMQQTQTGRTVMAMAFPIRDNQGQIVRVISFSRDHSDILRLQQEYSLLREQVLSHVHEDTVDSVNDDLKFRSQSVREIVHLIQRTASTTASVLLEGESGAGKTLFARYIHNCNRPSSPFIEVNCGAIPESLFESEMFGYAPGSFTGALKQGKQGLIESADGGTLFLDEIGELPVSMQIKLLKVIQDREVTRVGSTKAIAVDFRLISATNKNLEIMVQENLFRLDLYYRLKVIPIIIPALRDRPEDIAIISHSIIDKLNERYQQDKVLSEELLQSLIKMPWPGNIRELENYLECLHVSSPAKLLTTSNNLQPIQNIELAVDGHVSEQRTLKEVTEETEFRYLSALAGKCKTTYQLAELSGISQPSVVRKLKKHRIKLNKADI